MDSKHYEEIYTLFDGSEVSKKTVLDLASRYQSTYKGLGAIMVGCALITTIAILTDLDNPQYGFLLTLALIDLLFIILAVLFFTMYHKMDLIKLGLSILNFRRHQYLLAERNTDDYNEIDTHQVVELHVKRRHFVFVNSLTHRWQYRMGRFMSDAMPLSNIKSIEIKPKNRFIIEVYFIKNEGRPIRLLAESMVKVERIKTLFEKSNP
jgi:hypothetical protein